MRESWEEKLKLCNRLVIKTESPVTAWVKFVISHSPPPSKIYLLRLYCGTLRLSPPQLTANSSGIRLMSNKVDIFFSLHTTSLLRDELVTKNFCGRSFIDRGNLPKLSPINFTCCCSGGGGCRKFQSANSNFHLKSFHTSFQYPSLSHVIVG